MNFSGKKILKDLIYSAIAVFIMWAGWSVVYIATANEYVVPSAGDAFIALGKLFKDAAFWSAFLHTALRALMSFSISFVSALALSLLSSAFPAFKGILKPFISVIRAVPTMAVILALLIWTSPKTAPVIVTFLVSFPLSYSTFMTAFENIDPKLVEMSKVYNVSLKRRITGIYVPLSLPYVLRETGTQLSFSIKVMVSSEVLSKTYNSIGGMMSDAKMLLEIPQLIALTITVVITGIICEAVFIFLDKLIVRWKKC